jgi:hypothetical protein
MLLARRQNRKLPHESAAKVSCASSCVLVPPISQAEQAPQNTVEAVLASSNRQVDAAVAMETDRITNRLNTLGGQVTEWEQEERDE